jgi:hypothetical protein
VQDLRHTQSTLYEAAMLLERVGVLELGRAAAKKGLAITPIFGGLAAGGPSEKLFARSIMYHRTSTLQLIHSTLHDPFQH